MLRSKKVHSRRVSVSRSARMAGVAAGVVLAVTACSSGSVAPENVIAVGEFPDYYPADYQDLVDAAEAEGGELTIYSNIDEENWTPIFRDFKKKYPFVKSISANNLDSDEIFQRVLSEEATSGSPSDIIVSGAAQGWADYAQGEGAFTEYASAELSALPDFAELLPNVYALSMDPMGILYNTQLIESPVTGFGSLGDLVAASPADFSDKITIRDVGSSFGFSVSHGLTVGNPDAWEALEKILPQSRAETSSGAQTDKLLAGEYEAAFIVSAAVGYPAEDRSSGLVKFVLPDDGAVIVPRGVAVAPSAPHPSTAKLFVDFLLSEEGQNAVAEGGLTSYRDSVAAAEGLHTYQEVVEEVGEDGVIIIDYALVEQTDVDAFTSRWNALVG